MCALNRISEPALRRTSTPRSLHAADRVKPRLRFLLVEDNAADAELIEHQLMNAGFVFFLTRVHTEREFCCELQAQSPDVILSDHGLPSFSGFRALEITRADFPRLPFIFVSGSNDQGMVADMYEQGATDYVFKRDLGDLKVAVLKALEEAVEKQPALDSVEGLPNPIESESIAATALISDGSDKIYFCPRCWQARDELGQAILIESHCSSRPEITVVRQVCARCK